jgi:glycosyltransferase involved in cell wall biosynthesis
VGTLILYGTTPMSSLRILHVVPYFEGAWAYGGIPRLAATMVRGLVKRGHHVTVCTTDACDARTRLSVRPAADATGLDVRIFRNISNALAYHWQMFTPVGLFTFLRRHARSFDVAHLHACRNLPGLLAADRLVRAGIPYVVSPNGTAPAIERRIVAKRVFDRAGGRRVLENAARVIAVTKAERSQLLTLGIEGGRIVDIPNPLDETEFGKPVDRNAFRRALGVNADPIVMFLGKLTPRKGVDVLVRSLSFVKTPRAQLVIAGNDMGAESAVAAAVRESGVSTRVSRVGLLRGTERLEAVSAADVVVYPSRDEIFGLVPLEAILCGTPVVVCNDSGCGEVIGRIGGGHIVPHGEPGILAEAIDSILAAPDLWRARARTAAARATALFGSAVVCEQLEHVYSTLATSPVDRRPAS